MEFSFEAKVVLHLEHKQGQEKSKHKGVDFNLSVSKGLDAKAYFDAEGLPNQAGYHVLTNVLIQGIIGNIHQSHENGYRDSAEHLRYIISELERGFVEVAEVTKSDF